LLHDWIKVEEKNENLSFLELSGLLDPVPLPGWQTFPDLVE
jgi:hypothetical protein